MTNGEDVRYESLVIRAWSFTLVPLPSKQSGPETICVSKTALVRAARNQPIRNRARRVDDGNAVEDRGQVPAAGIVDGIRIRITAEPCGFAPGGAFRHDFPPFQVRDTAGRRLGEKDGVVIGDELGIDLARAV